MHENNIKVYCNEILDYNMFIIIREIISNKNITRGVIRRKYNIGSRQIYWKVGRLIEMKLVKVDINKYLYPTNELIELWKSLEKVGKFIYSYVKSNVGIKND